MERREVGAVGRGDMEGFISAAFFLFRMCVVLLMFFSYTTGAALKKIKAEVTPTITQTACKVIKDGC